MNDDLPENYKPKILIIEDEPGLNKLIINLLNSEGHEVTGVFSGKEAIEWVKKNPENLLIIDYLLPDMTALELVEELNVLKLKINFIVLTGFQDQRIAIQLIKKGARDYIIKDSNFIDIIIDIVKKALNEIEKEKKLELANQKIINQNELLTSIISHIPNYIFWKDRNSIYLGCNEKFAKVLGFNSPTELIGKNDYEIGIEKKDAMKFIKYDQEVINNGNTILGIEEAFLKNIGKKLPLLTNRAPLRDQNNEISGIIAICTDISDLEEMDETIKTSEERFRELFDNMVSGVVIYDPVLDGEDFIIKNINRATSKIEKIKRDDIVGKSVLTVFPTVKEYGLFDVFKRVYKTGKPENFPLKEYKDSRISGWRDNFIYKLSSGEIVAIYNDFTMQKKYEEMLFEYKQAIESSSDMIYSIDSDYKFVFANQAFLDIFGVTRNEIINKNADELLGKKLFETVIKEHIDRALKGEIYEQEGERIFSKLGKRKVKIKCYPLRKDSSDEKKEEYNSIVAVMRDVTEQSNLEIELKKLNEELENRVKERTEEITQANKELESFAYSVSHDLRAPLRHIYGFSELLEKELKTNLSESGKKYLTNIIDSSKKMTVLIDDLLSFSRMGRTSLNYVKIDFNKLLAESIKFLENDSKKRTIVWKIGKLPKIEGDLSMMRQVLINFLSNALKYTRNKKKTIIEIGSIQKKENNNVTFYFKDNGIGFDPNYKEKLFGVFQRLHSEKEFEGTGIGLALVKRIILRHNGTVWAEGNIGKGAAFYFTLPKEHIKTAE